MKVGQIQTRVCESCLEEYDHTPFVSAGVDLLANVQICDSCSEEKEVANEERRREEVALKSYERVVPKIYRLTRTDHPDYPLPAHDMAQKWAMGKRPDDSFWFGLIGPPGKGKTRVLSQALKRLIWQGASTEWATSTRFAWNCENMFQPEAGKQCRYWLDRYLRAGVLVFDDLGKQKWTERVCAQFFDLLEHRNGHMLPILWSSNEDLETLGKSIPTKQRGPIIDRLRGNSLMIQL